MNPEDPAHVDVGKNVRVPVVSLTVFGSALLAAVFVLPGRSVRLFPGRVRRGIALASAVCAVAVATLPVAAVAGRACWKPPVAVPFLTAPVPDHPVLEQVEAPNPRGDVDKACAATLPAAGAPAGPELVDTNSRARSSTVRMPNGVTRAPPGIIMALAVAPDGSFATGDTDGIARLWDATARRVNATFIGTGWVNSVAFSPDGRPLMHTAILIGFWAGLILLFVIAPLTAVAHRDYRRLRHTAATAIVWSNSGVPSSSTGPTVNAAALFTTMSSRPKSSTV